MKINGKCSYASWILAAAALTAMCASPASGVPSDPSGIQAGRIADMMEIFGANVYFNGQDGADGDNAAGIIAAAKYITGTSGMTMMFRGYAGNVADFATNGPVVFHATGGKFSLCMDIGQNPDSSHVIGLAKASAEQGGWIQFIEGGNEPDMKFSGVQTFVSPDEELAAQQKIYQAVHLLGIKVAAPSVTLDVSHISAYWGTNLSAVVAASDLYNTHLYPNFGGPNSADELYGFSQAVSKIWDHKPGIISEWQPVLYENGATDDTTCAYWAPIMLLSSYVDMKVQALFWWEMFDYSGFHPHVGLFKSTSANPYPAARVMKAMYALTGDNGSAKHTFIPGKLDLTITGLPPGSTQYNGGRWAVFQNSTPGTFFVFIWNEQNSLDASATNSVNIVFNACPMSRVVDYSLTNPVSESPEATQTLTNVSSVSIKLGTEVRLLQITHP